MCIARFINTSWIPDSRQMYQSQCHRFKMTNEVKWRTYARNMYRQSLYWRFNFKISEICPFCVWIGYNLIVIEGLLSLIFIFPCLLFMIPRYLHP